MSSQLKAAGLLAAAAISWNAAAQTNLPSTVSTSAATAPPAGSRAEKIIKGIKNPAPWFYWGADLRVRNEYFNNAITLNEGAVRHEQDYFRFRERLWASVMPLTNVSVNARFSGEQREWMKPSYASQFNFGEGLEWRYGIVDNAYVKWTNIASVPLTLAAGRQDVQFGEPLNWWLVADGTPGDGSWTFFLDSIRAMFDAKGIKTKFDVVYIYQTSKPDQMIPTLGQSSDNKPTPYYLTEQDEQGVIFYLSNATTGSSPTATTPTSTPSGAKFPARPRRTGPTPSRARINSAPNRTPLSGPLTSITRTSGATSMPMEPMAS
jgi:hypothetical protein